MTHFQCIRFILSVHLSFDLPQGREEQSEFNESLAMLKADTATEGSSLAFTAA